MVLGTVVLFSAVSSKRASAFEHNDHTPGKDASMKLAGTCRRARLRSSWPRCWISGSELERANAETAENDEGHRSVSESLKGGNGRTLISTNRH